MGLWSDKRGGALANHRIKKESYVNGNLSHTTYYVRDVAGQVMAIYTSRVGFTGVVTEIAERPIYGSGRIGVAYTGGNTLYELTDHLGNVRAVFTKDQGNTELEGYTDYYPFGMPMPQRNTLEGEAQYRYAYQGQEKDDETGKEAFELRLWDSRIGRWLTTDPEQVHPSPYLGMGNNPLRLIDPDGGSPLDIIFRVHNPTTGGYDNVLVIKSDIVRRKFDIHFPIGPVYDPITGAKPLLPPLEIDGFDTFVALSGGNIPDALKFSINADASFAIGVATSIDFVGFLNGIDQGKIFAYAPTGGGGPFTIESGFGAGISAELGAVYDFGNLDNFNRFIFEGKETGFSASRNIFAGSVFLGVGDGGFAPPTYIGFTFGLGLGTPASANGTLWTPDYNLLDWDLNREN